MHASLVRVKALALELLMKLNGKAAAVCVHREFFGMIIRKVGG